MFQYDVKSAHTEGPGPIVNGRNRIKGVVITPGATAGDVIFRDGNNTGPVVLQINITINLTSFSVTVPGDGILCNSGIYVDMPVDAKITVFYG